MTAVRRTVACLSAVGLVALASLPGQLQLVHQHAGGDHAHVHADAESLAAHDLLAPHEHGRRGHAHAHPHPHLLPAGKVPRGHVTGARSDGSELWAVAVPDYHVHGLNPFQQLARTAPLAATLVVSAVRAETPAAGSAPFRALSAARSRGPPTLFLG